MRRKEAAHVAFFCCLTLWLAGCDRIGESVPAASLAADEGVPAEAGKQPAESNQVAVSVDPTSASPAATGVDVGKDGSAPRGTSSASREPGRRPNVLFVMTDDQSDRTVGCYQGRPWVRTPNIDRLAAEGVRFARAYGHPSCTVSRAALLTGLLPHAIESLKLGDKEHGYDPEVCRFWPADLRKSGYHTALIGKWHLGSDTGHGRDWDHSVVWIQPPGLRQPNQNRWYFDPKISIDGGPTKVVPGYSTDLYTQATVDYIRRDHDRPWFLWLCYNAPHAPFLPHERHRDQYQGIVVDKPVTAKPAVSYATPSSETIHDYNRLVSAIDEGMGQILAALEATGQLDDTVIVFTSDQGFAWGEQGILGKLAPYDPCLRVPMIVRYPGVAAPGSVCPHPVSLTDLPPTLLSLCQTPLPWPMHGHDLRPLLEHPESDWDRPVLLENFYVQYGSDTDVGVTSGPTLSGIPWWISLTWRDHKYIRTLVRGDAEEFYALDADWRELRNLALEPEAAGRLAEYRARTVQELKRTGAGLVDTMPPPRILYPDTSQAR